jgi:hypothetical protein
MEIHPGIEDNSEEEVNKPKLIITGPEIIILDEP